MLSSYGPPGGTLSGSCEHKETGETIQAKVKIFHSVHSPYNAPVWLVCKPDDSWSLTMDYTEINKVVPPLFSAVPNVTTIMDTLSVELGTYHFVLDLANAFFSIHLHPDSQDQFAFT